MRLDDSSLDVKLRELRSLWLLGRSFAGKFFCNLNVPTGSLNGGEFDEGNFDGTVFREVDFTLATFVDTKLTNCRFEKCNLSGALFRGADISDAVFTDCDLGKALFPDVIAEKTRFVRCTGPVGITSGYAPNMEVLFGELAGSSFRDLDLRYARFHNVLLAECDFEDADLEGADFSGAVITDTNLAKSFQYDPCDTRLEHALILPFSLESAGPSLRPNDSRLQEIPVALGPCRGFEEKGEAVKRGGSIYGGVDYRAHVYCSNLGELRGPS